MRNTGVRGRSVTQGSSRSGVSTLTPTLHCPYVVSRDFRRCALGVICKERDDGGPTSDRCQDAHSHPAPPVTCRGGVWGPDVFSGGGGGGGKRRSLGPRKVTGRHVVESLEPGDRVECDEPVGSRTGVGCKNRGDRNWVDTVRRISGPGRTKWGPRLCVPRNGETWG